MMNSINTFIKRIDETFMTGEEFCCQLSQFLENQFHGSVSLCFELTDKEGVQYTFGQYRNDSKEAAVTTTDRLPGDYCFQTKLWQNNDDLKIDECKQIFLTYWNSWYCDAASGLPDATKHADVPLKIERTIDGWKKEEGISAFIMIDLDHFSEVNEKYTHTNGTKVISEFSRILFKRLYRKCVVLHQSGDEFNILTHTSTFSDIIDLVFNLRQEVSDHQFKDAKDIHLTMACGVWIINNESQYLEIRELAENEIMPKERNQTKQRDSIRIGSKYKAVVDKENMHISIARIIGNRSKQYLFHNCYLDYIVLLTSRAESLSNVQADVDIFINWVSFEIIKSNYQRCVTENNLIDYEHKVASIDIGLAVFQGILNNQCSEGDSVKLCVNSNHLQLYVGNNIIYQLDIDNSEDIEWQIDNYKLATSGIDVRNTVLIQPGYRNDIGVPEDVFYSVIRVDERPTIGGGLPDFWALGISSLINCVETNPNVKHVIVNAKNNNIKRITDLLENLSSLTENDIHYLSQKTYKSEIEIKHFVDAIKDNVDVLSEPNDLINKTYEFSLELDYKSSVAKKDHSSSRFLERNLSYDKIHLNNSDGCRVNTLSQAFPIVLELLRKTPATHIFDPGNKELKELIAFKIVLNTPTVDILPTYYGYDTDRKELESYFNDNFLDDTGLFRKRLIYKDQLKNMINHVINTINKNVFTTRRAILVIDNNSSKFDDYSPLGLTSVWLAPRIKNSRIIIDYCYSWRTVEAIVGLPFSMYGSIRFSEWLNTEIINKVNPDKKDLIDIGSLTYIAYSLHMFTNEESLSITRGIINEVSI